MPQVFDTPLFTSDQSIDRVLNAGLPVVLVFVDGAAQPALDQAMKTAAKQDAGKFLVVQVNLKDSPETARRFSIHSAPSVVTVKNGQEQSRAEGIQPGELERHAAYLLGRGPKPQPAAQKPYAGDAAPGGNRSAYTTRKPVQVTDASFDQEVMRSPLPVIVDFWAPWCGPCRMVAPVLEKLAREWNGKVKIAKVNVDENPNIAGRYGITSIPTMMVVMGGRIADRWAGALPEPAMRARFANTIK